MRLKNKIVILEAILTVMLSSANLDSPINSIDIQAEEIAAVNEVEEEYVPSIADRVYHYENNFIDVEKKAWIIKNSVCLKTSPYEGVGKEISIKKFSQITVTGENDYTYYRVIYNGNTYYMHKDDYTTNYSEYQKALNELMYNTGWTGARLTASAGTIYGPSGKETYYNLPMDGVIAIMRSMGNYDTYWVRSDGVKMLGNYVMIAASLDIRPRGSYVPTSLGMGIVCDTGGFALGNKTQIDIAVSW